MKKKKLQYYKLFDTIFSSQKNGIVNYFRASNLKI